jgi:TolB-like protein
MKTLATHASRAMSRLTPFHLVVLALLIAVPTAALAASHRDSEEAEDASSTGPVPDYPGLADSRPIVSRPLPAEMTASGMADAIASEPEERRYDVAIVPFRNIQNKEKAGVVYQKLVDLFKKKGFRICPRPDVEMAVRKTGVLTSDAVQTSDYQDVAQRLSCRYVVLGAVKVSKADTGFSAAGVATNTARMLIGPAMTTPAGLAVTGGALIASLLGGFTASAGVEFEARVYDGVVRKIIWIGAEGAQQKKTWGALWANKKQLEDKAIGKALQKVFGNVLPHMQVPKHKRRASAD